MTKKKRHRTVSGTSCDQKPLHVRLREIDSLFDQDPININLLRRVAVHGLVNDTIRKRAWPLLLNIDVNNVIYPNNKRHKDWEQIKRDVDRSLWQVVTNDTERLTKRMELNRIINAVLCQERSLHYYQGYHDIAAVFLLTCGERIAYALLRRLSVSYIHDYCERTLEKARLHLALIYAVLRQADRDVISFLEQTEAEPIFALPWLLTWFSHVTEGHFLSCRIFDFLLASHPLMNIILSQRQRLLSSPCDYSAVHYLFTRGLEFSKLPFDELVACSMQLFASYPPNTLERITLQKLRDSHSQALVYPYEWMKQSVPRIYLLSEKKSKENKRNLQRKIQHSQTLQRITKALTWPLLFLLMLVVLTALVIISFAS